ncbi:hypothetical protein Tco_1078256 [Tanacetum coccineum]
MFELLDNSSQLEILTFNRALEMIPDDNCLVAVHLENVNVTYVSVSSLSKCRDLLIVDNVQCTNVGLISVAENSKGLKKLCVAHWNQVFHRYLNVVIYLMN